jgi:hypothetical protein
MVRALRQLVQILFAMGFFAAGYLMGAGFDQDILWAISAGWFLLACA